MKNKFKVRDLAVDCWADESNFVVASDGSLMIIEVGTRKIDPVDPDRYEIVWSVGLAYMDSGESYQGDIIEFIYSPELLNRRVVGVIEKDKYNNWGIRPINYTGELDTHYHIENVFKSTRIGNKYENPELVEQVK